MLHVNVRLPQYVVDHFKAGPKYTQEMRRVLTEYVDNEAASRPLENEMNEYKKIVDERFHGGEASVKIDGDQVSIYSSAGFQILEVSDLPEDLIKKIQEENDDNTRSD